MQKVGNLSKMSNKQAIAMLDPRSKIAILLMISVLSFAGSGQLLTEAIGIGLICIVMLVYRRWRSCFKSLIAYLIVFSLVLVSSSTSNMWVSMLAVMLVMIRKMMSILMFASFLIATTKVGEMIAALQKIHIPKNIVIPTVVMMRFFPTLSEEYHCILDAMKIRGIRITPKNLLRHPLRLCEYILVPMILRLSTIADELSAAAVSRGIDAKIKRTSYYDVKFHVIDIVFILLFGALMVFTLAGGMEVFR